MKTMLAALALLAAPALAQPAGTATPGTAPLPAAAQKQASPWPVTDGDHFIRNFRFATGEVLPEVRMHYRTLGTPQRDKTGRITNAVVIMHGTGGTGATFLRPIFAGELFGPGQPLDTAKYFIVLPDALGHGGSSKPSDGLRMAFPRYDYVDMVRATHAMLTDGLKVGTLRLVMGTSMGCMESFVWGYTLPGTARAFMPLACNAVEMAGRNRMWRKMSIDAIRADPAWNGGNYTAQPVAGLRTAAVMTVIAGTAPARLQAELPTREAADKAVAGQVEAIIARSDANDLIYQLDASRTYNPWPHLAAITVSVTWVNSADDFINPPGLATYEPAAKRMPKARFVMIPESAETHGHGTHTWAAFWKQDLVDLLKRSE